MNKILKIIFALIICAAAVANCPNNSTSCKPEKSYTCKKNQQQPTKKSKVQTILQQLYKKTSSIKTLQADLKYLFIQEPDLIDARTLRKAKLFYDNTKKGSKLRINFETIKYDSEKPKEQIEHFIFKNYQLIKIDYQLKTIEYHQLPKPKKDTPFDAFSFLSQNFPMVGFTNPQKLKKQFNIKLIKTNQNWPQNKENNTEKTDQTADPNEKIHLFLDVKPESVYKNDYKNINLWIKKDLFLPAHFRANSVNNDIYDIKLLNIAQNKILKNAVFEVETPAGFSENIFPLDNN